MRGLFVFTLSNPTCIAKMNLVWKLRSVLGVSLAVMAPPLSLAQGHVARSHNLEDTDRAEFAFRIVREGWSESRVVAKLGPPDRRSETNKTVIQYFDIRNPPLRSSSKREPRVTTIVLFGGRVGIISLYDPRTKRVKFSKN